MNPRQVGVRLLVAASLAGSFTVAARADSGAHVDDVNAPDGTDARLRGALKESIRQHLARAHLDTALAGYALSPSLIQLRRYVEPAPARTKLVCIVGIALRSERGVVADVRGNASTLGASPLEAIDAAADAAVQRLPSALAQAQARPGAAAVASNSVSGPASLHLGQPR